MNLDISYEFEGKFFQMVGWLLILKRSISTFAIN